MLGNGKLAPVILYCFLLSSRPFVDSLRSAVGFHKPPVFDVQSSRSRLGDSRAMSFSSWSRLESFSLFSFSSSAGNNESTHAKTTKPTTTTTNPRKKKLPMYSFSEARKLARGHGFGTLQEFLDYDCPGAYQLPKEADAVWASDWTSWGDFLGLPLEFEEAREIARKRVGPSSVTKWKVATQEEYQALFEQKQLDDGDIASRLPYRPDLKYKTKGWISWEDFLREE